MGRATLDILTLVLHVRTREPTGGLQEHSLKINARTLVATTRSMDVSSCYQCGIITVGKGTIPLQVQFANVFQITTPKLKRFLQGQESFLSATPSRGTRWTAYATQNAYPATPQRRTYAGRLNVLPGLMFAAQRSAWLPLLLAQEVLNQHKRHPYTIKSSQCPLAAQPIS